jgi:6,7-dimethyl-8-ribityllumazine synthase
VPQGSISVYTVPGSFELPLACLKAAESGDFDAVIALGVVIRGDTPHFEYVAGQTASGIMSASLATEIPILFGVITADTEQQAVERSGERENNKGFEAALSAVEMVNLLRDMGPSKDQGWVEEEVFPHVV